MTRKQKILSGVSLLGVSSLTLLTLVSCGATTTNSAFRYATLTDPFVSSVSTNNPTFSDAVSTTFFQSSYISLVSWRTQGQYGFNESTGDLTQQPTSDLVLEAAKAIRIYDSSDTVIFPMAGDVSETGVVNQATLKTALLRAAKVEFELNEKIKWVDSNGEVRQSLVPNDFWYGLVSYYNSSTFGLNSNAYFMAYAGIDYEATKALPSNRSVTPGGTFTYIIGPSKSPYFLDILTKQYFFPIPSTHPETQFLVFDNTVPKPNTTYGPIAFSGSDESPVIDKTRTDWNSVFGSGEQQQTDPDAWYAGSYYVDQTSLQDIVFQVNESYYSAIPTNFGPRESKISRIILSYGNTYGTFEKIFRSYTTGELSYVQVQPEQTVEAYSRYRNSTNFNLTAAAKQKRTVLPSYNTQIYNPDGSLKSNISPLYARFIEQWSTNGLAIRKAINGAINYARLSEIVWKPGKFDFILSSVPYGNLNVDVRDADGTTRSVPQYQAITEGLVASNGVDVNGALAIPFSSMLASNDFVIRTSETEKLISDMNAALTAIGATRENPLQLDYRTLIPVYPTAEIKYNEELINAIDRLSEGRIRFNIIPRSSASIQDIFFNQNGAMGTFLWSADYSSTGTFLGYYFSLKSTTNASGDVVPLTINEPTNGDLSDNLVAPYFVASLWKPLFEQIQSATGTAESNWLVSLRQHLLSANVFNRTSSPTATLVDGDLQAINPGILDKQIGIWSDLNTSNSITLTQWIDSQYSFIPGIQAGVDYRGVELYSNQYKVVHSLNSDENYRDYVFNGR